MRGTTGEQGRSRLRADDSGDDNAGDNLAPPAQCGPGSRRRSRGGTSGCVLLGVKCATRSLRQEAVSSMVAPSAARCTASHPFLAAAFVS